jgi:hypothetical protein
MCNYYYDNNGNNIMECAIIIMPCCALKNQAYTWLNDTKIKSTGMVYFENLVLLNHRKRDRVMQSKLS